MKFIRIGDNMAINVASIDRITRSADNFAIVHVGFDQFKAQLTFESLINLMAVESSKVGDGPNPAATALAY